MIKEINFLNSFGDKLFGNAWEIEKPKYVLLLVTGMAEHSARYDDFASFLNKHYFNVFCLDHYNQGKNGILGHGSPDYFFKMEKTIDEYILFLKDKFNLPVFVFAHSMGSFVLQGYIENYHNADKVVLCGSNYMGPIAKVGNTLAKMIVNKKNYNKPAGFLNSLSIGAYEKTCKGLDSPNAWISYNKDNYHKYDQDKLCGQHCTNGFFKEFLNGLASLNKKDKLKTINKDLPILIIGGDSDPVGNNGKGLRKLDELYTKNGLNSTLIIYEHMKHEVLNEEENMKVYKDIANFLKA